MPTPSRRWLRRVARWSWPLCSPKPGNRPANAIGAWPSTIWSVLQSQAPDYPGLAELLPQVEAKVTAERQRPTLPPAVLASLLGIIVPAVRGCALQRLARLWRRHADRHTAAADRDGSRDAGRDHNRSRQRRLSSST